MCLLSVSMLSTEPSVQPLPCSLCRRRSSRQPLEGEFPMQGKEDSLWSRKTYTPTLARPLQCCVTLGNELHFCEPASSAGNLRWQQTITVPMHQALMHERPSASYCKQHLRLSAQELALSHQVAGWKCRELIAPDAALGQGCEKY